MVGLATRAEYVDYDYILSRSESTYIPHTTRAFERLRTHVLTPDNFAWRPQRLLIALRTYRPATYVVNADRDFNLSAQICNLNLT